MKGQGEANHKMTKAILTTQEEDFQLWNCLCVGLCVGCVYDAGEYSFSRFVSVEQVETFSMIFFCFLTCC